MTMSNSYLRQLREERGITAHALSQLTGISHTTISRGENKSRRLEEVNIDLLSKAMKLGPDERLLLFFEFERFPPEWRLMLTHLSISLTLQYIIDLVLQAVDDDLTVLEHELNEAIVRYNNSYPAH